MITSLVGGSLLGGIFPDGGNEQIFGWWGDGTGENPDSIWTQSKMLYIMLTFLGLFTS